MKTWVQINERLLEMESNIIDSQEFKDEWNKLLDIKIAGILKRNKYEGVKTAKKEKGGGRKKKNVGCIQQDMG